MRVFISWSGEPSRVVAEALGEWLQNVIQSVEPFLSVEIEKGARWNDELAAALESTEFGICCVTPLNQQEPWLLFESGALTKRVGEDRLSPLLIGLKPTNLSGPLASFQATVPEQDDMFRLVRAINQQIKNAPLTDEKLRRTFDKWWEDFDHVVTKVVANIEAGEYGEVKPERSEREMLEETLRRVRALEIRHTADAATIELARTAVDLALQRGQAAAFASGGLGGLLGPQPTLAAIAQLGHPTRRGGLQPRGTTPGDDDDSENGGESGPATPQSD